METNSVTLCPSLNVKWFLETYKNNPLKWFGTVIKREDGTYLSGREYISFLNNHLKQGHTVIPLGQCEGFDYQTGCPGHPVEEES